MKPVSFSEQTIIVAEHQPEYLPLPVHQFNDAQGRIAFCWRLSWRERFTVLFSGLLWHQVLTFNRPLQPQYLDTKKPSFNTYE